MPRRAMKIIPKQIVRNCEPFPERKAKQGTLRFLQFPPFAMLEKRILFFPVRILHINNDVHTIFTDLKWRKAKFYAVEIEKHLCV